MTDIQAPFPNYDFMGALYAGEELSLKEKIEPSKKAGTNIYSIKFCPFCPNNCYLFALVSKNSLTVYSINEQDFKIEIILNLIDPSVKKIRDIDRNLKNIIFWIGQRKKLE